MPTFTLVISCLTTFNLHWFMDLTFQVPMQYHSLQHWTLLLPKDTSTTECHFHFGPAASFFLELLAIALHSSPVAYWIPSNPEGSTYSVIYFCLFILFTGLSARILEWFITSSFSGQCFVRTLHYDLSILGGPAWHGSQLHWVTQAPSPGQGCDPWRGKGHEDSVI